MKKMISCGSKKVFDRLKVRRIVSTAAYTIIEFVIVIAAIGVLTHVATVNIGEAENKTRLVSAAHTALADLRLAQEAAMSQDREVNFVVDAGSNRYYAQFTDDGSYVINAKGEDLDVTFSDDNYPGVSISGSDSGGSLCFTVVGRPDDGSGRYFYDLMVMTLNDQMTITVFRSGLSVLEDVDAGGGGCGC